VLFLKNKNQLTIH